MTELEKCMAGECYNCHDKIFLDFKSRATKLLKKYNALEYEQKEEKERFEALLIKTHDLTLQAEKQEKAEKAVSKHTLRIGRK